MSVAVAIPGLRIFTSGGRVFLLSGITESKERHVV